MPKKFKNKYRISSSRLPNYDYSQSGCYFITICTKNRECFFGGIVDANMQLSKIGQIAQKYWLEIPNHFPFAVLDEFIIMPNHLHAIIGLDNEEGKIPAGTVAGVETPKLGVSTGGNKITNWGKGYLGLIINQYKRICTLRIRKNYDFFAWQSRFHDHIIRSDRSLNFIREYIQKNPLNWENDRNNPKNL